MELIYDLRCNQWTHPVGVSCNKVGFSWKVHGECLSESGFSQSAYQLIVKDLHEVIWNSHRVNTNCHKQIYCPIQLNSHTWYSWKVRIWDHQEKPTTWSHEQRFLTGLYRKDWHGQWITCVDIKGIDAFHDHVIFKKKFLSQTGAAVVLYVASTGLHELFINGRKVDNGVLNPHRNNLKHKPYTINYLTYYLPCIFKGENVVDIVMDAGFARMMKIAPALLVQGYFDNDDTKELISDESWICAKDGNKYLGKCEWGDYGGEMTGKNDYISYEPLIFQGINLNGDDVAEGEEENTQNIWHPVKKRTVRSILHPQMVDPDRVIATLQPALINWRDEETKVDMGRNFTGWLSVRLPHSDTPITISVSDKQSDVCAFNQKITYIPQKEGTKWYCSQFNFVSGRYFTFQGSKKPLRSEDIRGFELSSLPLPEGSFSCSNPLLTKIFKTDLETFQANTFSGLTSDCPHRERLGYGETASSTSWGDGLPWYDSGAFYREYLLAWNYTQREDGYYAHTAPDFDGGGGTYWSCFPVFGLDAYLRYYQDEELLKTMYPGFVRWLYFLQNHTENGLLKRYEFGEFDFLGDWAMPDGNDWGDSREAIYVNTCCYAAALHQCSRFAFILGKKSDAQHFSFLHSKISAAVRREYRDPRGIYCSKNARYQAFALWSHIGRADEENRIWDNMLQITRKKGYLDGGSAGMSILLKELAKRPEGNELIYQWMCSEEIPSFGAFLKAGETTWPEMWDMGDIYGASRIHTCYCGCAGWFAEGLCGIQINGDAIRVTPFIPEDMNWLRCHHMTSNGMLKFFWEKQKNYIRFSIDIPFGDQVTFYYKTLHRTMTYGSWTFSQTL